MNITVKTAGTGGYACRPDTTWERENKDFYCPDHAGDIWFSPVVFARISKAGKFIGRKFAGRYWDMAGFGLLLYPGDLLGKSLAFASLLDHTSYLPFPPLPKDVLGTDGGVLTVEKDGTELFSAETGQDGLTADALEDAIAEASMYVSQRIGDIVAVELAPASVLSGRNEKRTGAAIRFKDRELLRFCIVR